MKLGPGLISHLGMITDQS